MSGECLGGLKELQGVGRVGGQSECFIHKAEGADSSTMTVDRVYNIIYANICASYTSDVCYVNFTSSVS